VISPTTLLKRKSAFTLIELSIVLVIIGLIVASVTVGSILLKQSQLRSVMNDFSRFQSAVATFRNAYNYYPGDMPNASTFWTSCDAIPSNCNGNNNGLIELGTASATNEVYRAWQQLSDSGILPGSFNGLGGGTGKEAIITGATTNAPTSKYNNSAYTLQYFTYPTSFSYTGSTAVNFNYITFGAITTNNYPNTALLLPTDSAAIDSKIDDGVATTGALIGAGTGCASATTVGSTYAMTTNTVKCVLYNKLQN
jgi:prepilin-type N-terminal cleavage/methylation domain-containing protein